MKKLIILFIIILSHAFIYANDFKEPSIFIGFQDIFLSDSRADTLKKITKYRLNYQKQQLETQRTFINPYLMLARSFQYKYTPSALIYNIHQETYYITLNLLDIKHENFEVHSKGERFFLQFLKLNQLKIKKNDLTRLNSYLKSLSFYFFSDIMYQIKYSLKLNMDDVKRLFDNFRERYGKKYRIEKKNQNGNTFNAMLTWVYEDIVEINISFEKETYHNLIFDRLDLIRNDAMQFDNQIIHITITNKTINDEISRYKSNIYKDILDTLKQEAENQLSKLKIMISSGKYDNQEKLRRKNHKRYQDIDDL